MNRKSILAVAIIILFAVNIYSQSRKYEAVKNESYITYKLVHPLHEIESTSKSAICLIEADAKLKEIKLVAVKVGVETFNSGNSNRDSHAMEVVEALKYPDAIFKSTSIVPKGDSIEVSGLLTFHGITKGVTISAFPNWSNNKLIVSGNFDISLTAFHIERPSLLLIPVKDTLKFTLMQSFNL